MLGILTFVPQELSPLLRQLRDRRRIPVAYGRAWTGLLGGIPTALTAAGSGPQNAERAFEALLEAVSPRTVAVCGVAAGLDPRLRVGDVVVADTVIGPGGTRFPVIQHESLPNSGEEARMGPLLTVPRVLVTAGEKRAVAGQALAADIETATVAQAAQSAVMPWCAVRAISDTADESLPLDFNRCLGTGGGIEIAAVLRELARRPTALPGLLRLSRSTTLACASLARFASGYLPAWYRSLTLPG